jgi:hypothetical protein
MRTHGWSGATPADDDEVIARILDAVRHRIDLSGKEFGISDVAKDSVLPGLDEAGEAARTY